jgi:hypothetical protein
MFAFTYFAYLPRPGELAIKKFNCNDKQLDFSLFYHEIHQGDRHQ